MKLMHSIMRRHVYKLLNLHNKLYEKDTFLIHPEYILKSNSFKFHSRVYTTNVNGKIPLNIDNTEGESRIAKMREAFDLFEKKKSQEGDTTKLKSTILVSTGADALLKDSRPESNTFLKRKSKKQIREETWKEIQASRRKERLFREKLNSKTASGKSFLFPEVSNVSARPGRDTPIVEAGEKTNFDKPEFPRILKVAIMGNPNAGKSTFLNNFLGKKVSAVSSKICTTRDNTQSIFTDDNVQIIFYDTPGIIESDSFQSFNINNELIADARLTLDRADMILLMIDSTRDLSLINHIINDIRTYIRSSSEDKLRFGIVAVLNKKDLVFPKTLLQKKYVELEKSGIFTNIFFACAENGHGISNVKEYLKKIAPMGDWLVPRGQISALNRDEIIKEVIREKLFTSLNEDIPYALQVEFSPIDKYRLRQILPTREQQEAVLEQNRHLVFFDKPDTGKKYVEIHVDIYCPSGYSIMIVRQRLKRIHPKIIKALQPSFPSREIVLRILCKLKDKEEKQTILSSSRLKRLRMRRKLKNQG